MLNLPFWSVCRSICVSLPRILFWEHLCILPFEEHCSANKVKGWFVGLQVSKKKRVFDSSSVVKISIQKYRDIKIGKVL